jgi:hypothetical protein
MREQPTRIITGTVIRQVVIFAIIAVTVLLALAVMFVIKYEPPYQPPPFELNAVQGVPNPPENMGYSDVDAMGKFIFWLASTMYQQKDRSLCLYLTNPQENEVYIMCRIVDEKDKTLYKSGLIRPGEYVERLYPIKKIKNKAVNIEVNIYAFDPENFQSVGTVTLDNILQPY